SEVGQLGRTHRPDELGKQRGERRLERDDARKPARAALEARREGCGHFLERAVLQEPGEQQVTRLEELEVLGVLDVALRQEPGGLEVQERRGDDEELARLTEVKL